MRRITKVAVAAAATLTAVVATASAASATVTVENGVGHVDKGDVQTALKWNNGDFDKGVGSLTFTRTMTRTTDNLWSCTNGVGEQHAYRVTVMNQPLNKTALLSSNGKQITGWDLTGAASAPNTVLSDTGVPAVCPGSHIDIAASFFSPAGLAVNTLASTTVAPGVLQVTGNGVTKDLPNTPVDSVA